MIARFIRSFIGAVRPLCLHLAATNLRSKIPKAVSSGIGNDKKRNQAVYGCNFETSKKKLIMERQRHTPPKTNMTIEKWWLSIVLFVFGGVMEMHGWKKTVSLVRYVELTDSRYTFSKIKSDEKSMYCRNMSIPPTSKIFDFMFKHFIYWTVEIQLFRHTSSEDSSSFSLIRMNKIWANELNAVSSLQGRKKHRVCPPDCQ